MAKKKGRKTSVTQPPTAAPAPPPPSVPTKDAELQHLKLRYPGREPQIDQLSNLLRICKPVFVEGPSGTGKTSIIRELVSLMQYSCAYVNCYETIQPRTVAETILHHLKGTKRKREDGHAPAVRCDNIASAFLATLPSVLSRCTKPAWIILDNAQRLPGSDTLNTLVNLTSTTDSKIGVILISSVPWDAGNFLNKTELVKPLKTVLFPPYTEKQMLKIFVATPPQSIFESAVSLPQAYRQFLQTDVPALYRSSNNLYDIRLAVETLWPKYCAPVATATTTSLEGGGGVGQQQPQAMMGRVREELKRMIADSNMERPMKLIKIVSKSGGGEENTTAATTTTTIVPLLSASGSAATATTTEHRISSQGLSFELPYMSKFLLLAAYVASRNKATTDRTVFDPGFSPRGRRNSMGQDRAAEEAEAAFLRGAQSFPLERLLHIFYCMYEQHGPDEGGDHTDGGGGTVGGGRGAAVQHEVQRSEVLMQISTLVSLKLLRVSGGDVAAGGVYSCKLDDALAVAIATNLKIRLGDYLKLSA